MSLKHIAKLHVLLLFWSLIIFRLVFYFNFFYSFTNWSECNLFTNINKIKSYEIYNNWIKCTYSEVLTSIVSLFMIICHHDEQLMIGCNHNNLIIFASFSCNRYLHNNLKTTTCSCFCLLFLRNVKKQNYIHKIFYE